MPACRVALALDLQWPYKRHSQIFAGVQRFAEEQGWVTILDEFPHDTLRKSRRGSPPYDGILARAHHTLIRHATHHRVPVVNVWPSSPARRLVPAVVPDSVAVGRLLAEHLLARGFRTFATLTSPHNVDNEHEAAEFDRLVTAAGYSCSHHLFPQHPHQDLAHWRATERSIDRALDEWTPPIGLYVGQEAVGRLVVQHCQRRGWRIPEDVAIIAGKNEETLCEQPRPSLTSVEIGYDRIGYAAAELLAGLMAGKEAPMEPLRIAPHGLVVRESTDFYAVDDPVVAAALAFIAANSHRVIGPGDVAAAVGTETRTLQNYFARTIRRPIATEIRRIRVERAKRELTQSRRPLAGIAHDVGFGTIQRLYEVFCREVGVSPGEYRRQRCLDKKQEDN